jgi:hypothetical protein
VIEAPLAHALSAGLVRIEGGQTANPAAVSKSGQMLVNAGLATMAAGQVTSALASPSQTFTAIGVFGSCGADGFYKIRAGKALIVTGASFADVVATAGGPHGLDLYAGPAASPCSFALAAADAPSSENDVSQ